MIKKLSAISLIIFANILVIFLLYKLTIAGRLDNIEAQINNPKQIVSVDYNALYREFVIEIEKSVRDRGDLSERQMEILIERRIKEYKTAIKQFNQEIINISQKNNLVILNQNAVLSGAKDHTKQAKDLLIKLMDEVEYD